MFSQLGYSTGTCYHSMLRCGLVHNNICTILACDVCRNSRKELKPSVTYTFLVETTFYKSINTISMLELLLILKPYFYCVEQNFVFQLMLSTCSSSSMFFCCLFWLTTMHHKQLSWESLYRLHLWYASNNPCHMWHHT